MSRGFVVGLAFFLFGPVAFSADPLSTKDQKWGDLTGRFIFDGKPPKPVEFEVHKDKADLKGPLFSESLVVDAKNCGIANLFVWLVPERDKLVATHPDYEKSKKDPVVLQMKGLRFQPHCLVFRAGQELKVFNKDSVGHVSHFSGAKNPDHSSIIPPGDGESVLKNAEPTPSSFGCYIHPWMHGHYLVQDHPYMALTSTAGEFTLKNLPVGKHSFCFWHETCGFVNKVRRDGKAQEWKKGRLEFEIRPGTNDLGDVLVPAELLMLNQ